MYVSVFWSGMSDAISNKIMVYIVMSFFWAAQTVKLNSIFHMRNKSTRDLSPPFCRLENRSLSNFCIQVRRENCGQLSPHWVMSDTASPFYNTWVALIGGTPTCVWHVDRGWKQELRTKVYDSEKAKDIYKMLTTVPEQATTVPEFKTFLCKLKISLPSISARAIEREWLRKKEMWAYCSVLCWFRD